MNKEFESELMAIKDLNIRESISFLLDNLPPYFYHIPASSTGKYHPKTSLGEGGLVRHTKIAVYFAIELLNNPSIGDKYTRREKDLMIGALLLHDGIKKGEIEGEHTVFEHPLLVVNYIKNNQKLSKLSDEDTNFLASVISSHMGVWNKDPLTKLEVLPKPIDKYQNFVHMCDYLASRKEINIEFDDYNKIKK